MTADIWRHLGIPETTDEGAIRRAYAERLKVTNPEDDPEGFKRLRSAYERALQNARWRARYAEMDAEEDNYDDDLDGGFRGDLGEPRVRLPPPSDIEPPPPVEPDPELDAHNALRKKLEQAVSAKASPWDIQAAFQALVTNPAMERLPVYAATENWIANLIRNYDGGGPLLEIAIIHFKWNGRTRIGDLGGSMLAFKDTLAEEQSSRAFVIRVQDRRHEFYAAYRETSRPLEGRSWLSRLLSFPRIDLVRRFLDYIDDKVPYAYDELDYVSTDWWRRRIDFWLTPLTVISRLIPIAVILGIVALFIIIERPDDPSRPPVITRIVARDACAESVEQWSADQQGACERFLAQAPDSLLMRQYAGLIALREERFTDARAHFEAIYNISPLDPAARYGLGLALRGSADPAEQARGAILMREAFALDDTVSVYFAQYGFASTTTLDPADTVPTFPNHEGAPYDTPPGEISLDGGQASFDAAYEHFGIAEGFGDGVVRVQCLLRSTGRFTDCKIMEETPRYRGRGEIAIRVMNAASATPATANGQPVDGVAIQVPVRFNLAE